MTGVINLYKPKGITSSDAVVKVKKLLGTKAVGHMGTLDPQGEGVLILGVGKATRLFNYFLGKDKVYEAEFTFGYETDTLDGEGKVVKKGGQLPSEEEIIEAMKTLEGKQMQMPPSYSAKKINGVKAYSLARKDKEVTLSPSEIEVYSFQLLSFSNDKALVRVHCSSGTYIRSLCRDLAYKLGTYATMTAIKRTRCGSFEAENAVMLSDFTSKDIMSVEEALPEIPKLVLPDRDYVHLKNGVGVSVAENGKYLVFCKGEMFGIGESKCGLLKITVYMREE